MSAYDNDDRVTRKRDDQFCVNKDGELWEVTGGGPPRGTWLAVPPTGWAAASGDPQKLVDALSWHPSSDEAIASIIGPPQVAS